MGRLSVFPVSLTTLWSPRLNNVRLEIPNAAENVHRGRAQRSKLPTRALREAILWLTFVSEICNALVEVRATTSYRSPQSLSVFWGRLKSPAQ